MGTRSTTTITDGNNRYGTMYRHFDGYIEGHGLSLARFLTSRPVVNGIRDNRKVFNGPGCLAAHMFAEFKDKDGSGSIYVAAEGCREEAYHYEVEVHTNQVPRVKVRRYGEEIFSGTAEELLRFAE